MCTLHTVYGLATISHFSFSFVARREVLATIGEFKVFVNVEWSCDQTNDVSVHHKQPVVDIISISVNVQIINSICWLGWMFADDLGRNKED